MLGISSGHRVVGSKGGREHGEQMEICLESRVEAGLWVSVESVYPCLLSVGLQFQALPSFLVFCNLKEQRKDQG